MQKSTKRLFVSLVAASALFTAACQTEPNGGPAAPNTAELEASCQAEGGKLMQAKIGPICSMPASDAGQSCTSSSQCEGFCMANGQCAAHQDSFGCQDILEDGMPVTICID